MTDPTAYRDLELGAALRSLEVPDHGPSFFPDLERRLATAPRTRPTRRPRLRWGVRIVAVSTAVASLVAVVGLPHTERTQVASAAVVKTNVAAALARLDTLSGVLVADGPAKGDAQRFRFTLDARGDFRLTGPARGDAIAYDAASGVARSAQHSASMDGETIFYAERRGVAPGPPDQGPPTWILPDELGAYVRALLASGDPRVEEIDYEGRPAWRVEVNTVPNAIVPELSGDRLEITVDRRSGIPVRVIESKAGAVLRELRIEQLVVDEPVGASTFRLAFPGDAEVMRSDDGFRRVPLESVAAIVGYDPLIPAIVPDGFELADVTVARKAAPTGTEAGNPPSRMVVSLAYRRGLDWLIVTTRLAGDERWSDPLATGEGFADEPQRLQIDSGALGGADAELVLAPRGIPHVWSVADGLVVTVAGGVSRAELLSVAGSLRADG